ncbi:MAG: methyl-accepting chemotaxis protein [Nitrincola lacisaponensis]|uniref:Methyl-accepting chemotaxis protein I (Serine chemoreceptor protein) n=1 Tax=Nitrincola lacisaponensis TaxID=267850 RepID=A0A063Y8M0_9GAMM|nr:methyl-accepting chemotaxis protein [Nitrincola lacisaponensis]KDE41076.1 Methyl-accepting chemotaxis protein I (serine chemoreceptor protein) [Nitrincola lacisaponensis]
MSIKTKVNASLLIVFMVVLISSLTVIYRSETSLVADVARTTTIDAADSYFDSINILMLSGAMGNRKELQQRVLSNESIVEARILRSPELNAVYGPGAEDSVVRDDLDRRAMRGERVVEEIRDNNGHRLTVLLPMKAIPDYKGTNCMLCHQHPEGTVIGAVRVTYSLDKMNQTIRANMINVALVELALFIVGILAIGFILNRVVIRPVNQFANTLHEIEKDHNFNLRVPVTSDDEIGKMSIAMNSLLENMHRSLKQVSSTVLKLSGSSTRINDIANKTTEAVLHQQDQTRSVASAIEQMEASTRSVSSSSTQTVEASDLALKESDQGTRITAQAIQAIQTLRKDIDEATGVIQKLDDQAQNVGTVLEVIKNIAEQTNLLALNAAIEAARAGEQGRGFAVVADEVRTLASRTQASTEEINKIIDGLQLDAKNAVQVMQSSLNSAGEGVEQVQNTSNALNTIAAEIRRINDMNHEVAGAIREQSDMASSIERNILAINDSSEDSSEHARHLSQVSSELTSLAQELESMLTRFKL